MVKYQKILKSILLMTVVSGAVSGAFASGGDAVPYEDGLDVRTHELFNASTRSRGSYLKHQMRSIEVQDTIREAEKWWLGAMTGSDGAALALRLQEASERVAKSAARHALAKEYQSLPAKTKSEQIASLVEENIGLRNDIERLVSTDRVSATREAELAEAQSKLLNNEEKIIVLQNRAVEFLEDLEKAQEELARIQRENAAGTDAFIATFKKLIYTKFKTIHNLRPGTGAKALPSTDEEQLRELDRKYESTLSPYERGTIISPFKEMVLLLHEMGIKPDLITGLTSASEDLLHPQPFLYKLMVALEVPDPRFAVEDLPIPYYKKTATGYVEQTTPPVGILDAYGYMLDHLASIFNVRLQADVSKLRSIINGTGLINAEGVLGQVENPVSIFLARGNEIWNIVEDAESSLLGMWGREDRKPQEAFVTILQAYEPSFTLEGPVLDAAIPPNSLGMAYRLLQAAEKDIHSWNVEHDASYVAREKERRVIRTIEDKIRGSISPFSSGYSSASPSRDDGVWWQIHDDGMIRSDTNQGREDTILSFGQFADRYGITHDVSATEEFLETVQQIIARYYNLRVLEVMSNNIKNMLTPAKSPTRRVR